MVSSINIMEGYGPKCFQTSVLGLGSPIPLVVFSVSVTVRFLLSVK